MIRSWLISTTAFFLAAGLWACGGGSGGGGGVKQTDPATPSTPNGLSAQVVSSTRVDLGWNPSTDDIAVMGYYLFGNGATLTTFSTSYSLTGLTPGTRYCFSVASFDGDGKVSAQSASTCVTTTAEAPSAWKTVRSGTVNELSNIVWTGEGLLVVEETSGSSTKVHTSLDGFLWSDYPTSGFAFNGSRDVVYGGNRYVAVDNWFFTSPDGIAWELVGTDFSDARALAWSPTLSMYVAVGDAGYIATSADGRSWSTVDPSPGAVNLFGVAWLDGRFFAVGDGGAILTSSNGIDWTAATTPASSFALESIAWNGRSDAGSLYVATGYGTAFTSADGDTWTNVPAPPSGFSDSVVWGGGAANCFVSVGSGSHIFSSPDGVTWTREFLDGDPVYAQLDLNEVVWTGTSFVAVGQKGTILASGNGADWSIVASGADLRGLAHDGSRFIAVGDFGRLAVSGDGENWEYRHTGDDTHYLNDLVWDGSRYLAVGQTYSLYSGDLLNWQASWEGATSTDTAVVWDGSQFVRTGDGIMTWDGVRTYAGTNDPNWEWSHFTSTEWFKDLTWDGSTFVAVGNNGVIYTSPDASGGSWTARSSGTTSNLEGVTKGAANFVAVGAAGTILSSGDGGATWESGNSGASTTIYDVTWTGNRFVAVGSSGLILTSDDGKNWAADHLGSNHLYSVFHHGADTLIVGARGTIIKSNQ